MLHNRRLDDSMNNYVIVSTSLKILKIPYFRIPTAKNVIASFNLTVDFDELLSNIADAEYRLYLYICGGCVYLRYFFLLWLSSSNNAILERQK